MADNSKSVAKDFFLWIAAIAALYVSVISMVALLFEYIDRIFGDPLSFGFDPFSTGVRVAIASLIIVFPLYVWFTRILNKDIRSNPEKRDLWMRRWLLVLTLFVTGVTMVVDLIVLINAFLSGEEFTAAFALKVLAVLVVAGGVFLYYLNDIRGTWERKERESSAIGWIVSALVLAAVAAGFFIVGSPQEQRALRFDSERVSALQNIQFQVLDYYQRTGALPESLDALDDPLRGGFIPTDPETGEDYEYSIVNARGLVFELCATFSTDSQEGAKVSALELSPRDPFGGAHWEHTAERTCFARTIDPKLYPVLER